MKSYIEVFPAKVKIAGFQANAYYFRLAWCLFLTIGVVGFGFTFEQIEQAYYEKNKVNHKRQDNQY